MKYSFSLYMIPKSYFMLFWERKRKLLSYPLVTLISLLIASRFSPPILSSLVTILAMLFVSASVYIYNNITDLEMDKLNPSKANNLLPSGRVSVKVALSFVFVSSIIGFLLAFFTNVEILVSIMSFFVLYIAYSHHSIRLKKRFLLKEATIAAGLFISCLVGGFSAGAITPAVIFFALFMSSGTIMVAPTFVDHTDRVEDEIFGGKNLATILKWKRKMELVIAFVLIVMIITPLTYINLGFNVVFPIIVVASCLLFLRYLFPILNKFEEKGYKRAFTAMYCFWFSIQAALIFGSLPL